MAGDGGKSVNTFEERRDLEGHLSCTTKLTYRRCIPRALHEYRTLKLAALEGY